ncbi:MAG: hypothetical protein KDB52_05775 [Solirubrobacterales bacterium]|nr:hypothetical protein [Solirubrobacterales bacterium]
MKLKAKFGAFVATAAVACAIGAAPAQAAPSAPALPSAGDLSALCAKSSNAKIKSLCSQGVAVYNSCSKQTSAKGLASCLASAAKGIIGSGVPTSGGSSADIIAKLKSLIGGNTGGLSIGGFDLSSILGKLGGAGGLNLGGLLGKLGG